jgi:hypothetical protein
MPHRRSHLALALASVALVLCAAAVSSSDRWNFDFAQYRGPNRLEPKDEFRFVMVGDRNGGRVPGLMPQAFREINHLYPDFVISVGDLIDGPTNDPERIPQFWKEFDDEVAILKSPFVYVPGNHDIWNATSKDVYETRYGPSYRSFNYRGLHFITLDTEQMDELDRKTDRIDGKQLEWLREDIEQNRNDRPILVFMHKPIWQTGGLAQAEEVWKGLPVHVFAGHYHRYSYEEINGIPHIVLGAIAGGLRAEGDPLGAFRHYVLATVRDGDMKLALIRLGGVMGPEVVLQDELPGIQQLADACAIYREAEGGDGPGRVVFRNPLKVPVRLEIQRTNQTFAKPVVQAVLRADETSCASGETLTRNLAPSVLDTAAAPPSLSQYRVLFQFTNAHDEPQSIDFPVPPRRQRLVAAAARTAPPHIDGDLTDWSDAQWQPIADAAQTTLGGNLWNGPADLSGKFAIAEDAEHVYIAVRVTDDNVAFHATPTEGDGIELFAANPGQRDISFARDADWHRLVVTPFASDGKAPGEAAGAARLQQFGPKPLSTIQAAYTRDADGYLIELALSREQLGWLASDSAAPLLDIALNDRDQAIRREKQLTWSGTDRDTFSSRYYGRVQLATKR